MDHGNEFPITRAQMKSHKASDGTARTKGRRARQAENLPGPLPVPSKGNWIHERVAAWRNNRRENLTIRAAPPSAPCRTGPLSRREIDSMAQLEARLSDSIEHEGNYDSSDNEESNSVRKGVEKWMARRHERLTFRQKPPFSPVRSGPIPRNEKDRLRNPPR